MKRPIFVAELTINHLGMVNIAKAMIRAAKESGADYVKLKVKKVKKYYKSDMQKWREFDFIDYRHSLELAEEDFFEIDKLCKEIGMRWFSTVHDDETREFIRQFDPPLYKVASMDSDKEDFVNKTLEVCKKENKPMVISIGGKTEEFTRGVVDRINEAGIEAYILHTVSIYPTPDGESNINYIPHLIETYASDKIHIGYSGHEVGFAPSLLAATYGAEMIERHFTLSKDYNIHHIKAAITPAEFNQMVQLINGMLKEQSMEKTEMNVRELEFLKEVKYN